ncbi:39S ribosomal protein-A [Arachis hypogaea]|nr:39S ribosomal protein-A [Arachis hypogaea]
MVMRNWEWRVEEERGTVLHLHILKAHFSSQSAAAAVLPFLVPAVVYFPILRLPFTDVITVIMTLVDGFEFLPESISPTGTKQEFELFPISGEEKMPLGLILGIGRAFRRKRTSSLDILSSKRAPRGYYKGKNCKPTGFHTRKGGYVVVQEKLPNYIVPDLTDFKFPWKILCQEMVLLVATREKKMKISGEGRVKEGGG